jgi:uncharacterized protein (TIGR02271 family)
MIMSHTLVAAFDNLNEAQSAKTDLLTHHISESDIQLTPAATGTMSTGGSTATVSNAHHDDSIGHKISHFFSSLFGNDEDNQPHRYGAAYPEAHRRGATLLTVTVATDEQVDVVTETLEHNGAIDIDERLATWAAEGDLNGGVTSHIAGTHLGADHTQVVDRAIDTTTGTTAIPVIEEELRVGKREINTGRVRVVSRVSERAVEETISLHEEHAHIERRPVDRPAAPGELDSFKAGSLEIQETAEEVVVEKSARVVEEVTVGKQSSDSQETVRDTVRRTDVDVQSEFDSATIHETLVNPNDRLKDR